MHTQTLQRLRAEVEAASTLHLALGRIATKANPKAPTAWTGPLLEELEDLTDDDGGFAHAGLTEIRRRSGAALVAQFHSLKAALDSAPPTTSRALSNLLDATLVTATGNHSLTAANGVTGVLTNLVKSGELRLDFTMRAAMLARDGLPEAAPKPAPAKKAKAAPAKTPKRPAAKAKAKPAAKKAATKKAVAKPAKKSAKSAKASKTAKKPGKKANSKR